jgi:hypothetical protein
LASANCSENDTAGSVDTGLAACKAVVGWDKDSECWLEER